MRKNNKFKKSDLGTVLGLHLRYIITKYGYTFMDTSKIVVESMNIPSMPSISDNVVFSSNGASIMPFRPNYQSEVNLVVHGTDCIETFTNMMCRQRSYLWGTTSKKSKDTSATKILTNKLINFNDCFVRGMNYDEYMQIEGRKNNRRKVYC